MKIWKALTVLVGGPILGAVLGFIGAGLLLPPDPTGSGAPGNGFLLILGMLIGLSISGAVSVVAVGGMIYRAAKAKRSR